MEGKGRLEGNGGTVREFDSLKDLAVALKECEVLLWWRKHMFGIHDSGGLEDKQAESENLD